MRVITEDRLKELLPWPEQDQDVADGLNLATEECKEIDTLTVSKLRPMSEAIEHDADRVLAWRVGRLEKPVIIERYAGEYWLEGQDFHIPRNELIGWIPLPIYEPGKK